MDITPVLAELGIQEMNMGTSTGVTFFGSGETLHSSSPVNGKKIASLSTTTREDYELVMEKAQEAFTQWRQVPAPQRGEVVRQFGEKLREKKDALGKLVSYEMGKSLQEGWGEVQEMIDICDFAVGLSRQLYGLTIKSERSLHHMQEQWHPLGIVGLFLPLTFPLRFGVGTRHWHGFVAMWPFGNQAKKLRCAVSPARIFGTKWLRQTICQREFQTS